MFLPQDLRVVKTELYKSVCAIKSKRQMVEIFFSQMCNLLNLKEIMQNLDGLLTRLTSKYHLCLYYIGLIIKTDES